MTSDTQIGYGSRVPCHGRSCRPWRFCQAISLAAKLGMLGYGLWVMSNWQCVKAKSCIHSSPITHHRSRITPSLPFTACSTFCLVTSILTFDALRFAALREPILMLPVALRSEERRGG